MAATSSPAAPGWPSTSTGCAPRLTNQPLGEAKDPTKRSRGDLPLALAGHGSAGGAVAAFVSAFHPADYNGCWLLVGDRSSLWYVDFTGPGEAEAVVLPPGIHVLENKRLGEPSAKVDLVREQLGHPGDGDAVVAGFRRVLADHRIPEGDERPNAANCVHLDTFGTRSSCLVRVAAATRSAPHLGGARAALQHALRGGGVAVGRAAGRRAS